MERVAYRYAAKARRIALVRSTRRLKSLSENRQRHEMKRAPSNTVAITMAKGRSSARHPQKSNPALSSRAGGWME
jgi:hypothetical protein